MPHARSASAAPRRRTSPPRPRPRRVSLGPQVRRVRWDRVGRVALVVVLAVVAALYIQDALTYFATRSQATQQQAIVHQLVKENKALARQQQALRQPSTIVRDARELGMVLPGERSYVVTGSSPNQ